ncbi:hypothetical protein N1027_10670 [Herbiconiux sp. CPCC 205763]|uniref:Uncharacterized protein n=1 Tax=Herbiconiux aconitum TaxID=2970913 RepID=A0ABT2GR32_9MICO|nr:hypothetical protein [Herbiconiux aconitum]MCS5718596.1 hypothetical protein [Herbiconiux aconitum]
MPNPAPALLAESYTRRMTRLLRFTDSDAHLVPYGLSEPHNVAAWMSLPVAERVAHLELRVKEQLEAAAAHRKPAKVTAPASPAPLRRPAAAPETQFVPGRYYSPCSGGCGRMLPARSGRPTVTYCAPHCPAKAKR